MENTTHLTQPFTNDSNITYYNDDNNVLYYGLNGYGVTSVYLGIALVTLLIPILSTCMNGLTLYILFDKQFNDDGLCVILRHQSVLDVLCSISYIYNLVYKLIDYENFYECVIRYGTLNVAVIGSLCILLALTADRYIKIVFPYSYTTKVTPRRSQRLMVFCWIVSFCFCLVPQLIWNEFSSYEHCSYFTVCTVDVLQAINIVGLIIASLVMLMYGHIIYISYNQSKKIHDSQQATTNKRHKLMWWRPTKTVLIIVGINTLCWYPLGVYNMMIFNSNMNYMSLEEKETMLEYVSSLIVIPVIVNPVIYAWKIKNVNKAIRKILGLPTRSSFITDFELKEQGQIQEN